MSDFKRFIREVHRRSLWQVLGVYVVTAWVIIQFVDTLASALNLPDWATPLAFFLLIVGLPIVLATAFVQHGVSDRSEPIEVGEDARVSPEGWAGIRQHLTWRRALLAGAAAFAVLIAVAAGSVVLGGDEQAPEPDGEDTADPAVAVLPFTIRVPGAEGWSEGLVDALSPMIDGVAGIRAINSRTVLARWGEQGAEAADLSRSLAVAREAGARFALVGSAVASGATTRLELELFDGESGDRLDRGRVQGPTDDLLGLTDQAAAEAARLVLRALGRIPDVEPGGLTSSPEALTAFLEGEVAFRRFELLSARDAYERAVAADSAFALAHLRLSEVAQWGATVSNERQVAHMEAAARHLERLPERSAIRVRAARASGIEQLEILRRGVDRYPDDGPLWYDLGEALIHGSDDFPTLEEIEHPFERSLALEPDRAATYPHAIHIRFAERDDPARARQLLEDFNRVATGVQGPYSGDADPRVSPWAYDLIYGTPAEQSAARAAVDTLPPDFLISGVRYVFSPRRWDEFELLNLGAARHPASETEDTFFGSIRSAAHRHLLIGYALWRGRPRHALEFASGENLGMEPFATTSRSLLYLIHTAGGTMPDSVLDQEFGREGVDPSSPLETVFAAGAHAVDEGRWNDMDAAVTELTVRDSISTHADLLRAYADWKRGDVGAAIPVFERHHSGNRLVQWWLGDAYIEADRLEDAARVFESYGWNEWFQPFNPEPMARLKLARVYEALDRDADARAHYAYFVRHWEDAEPHLQPRVEEARSRLEELMEENG